MNLPYKFTVLGHKRANREPWYDKKGNLIDDGENHDILLGGGPTKKVADVVEANFRNNVPKGSWKFWIEENPDIQ